MSNIITRPCELTDNIHTICELIVLTDDYIYPPMFRRSQEELYTFFENCIGDEGSAFYYKNIFLALEGDEILGIIVSWKGKTSLASDPSFAEYRTREDIAYCNEHYFKLLFAEYAEKNEVTYISNICVKPKMRNRKIGRKMLMDFLKTTCGTVELDVLCGNQAAIHLYESCGFSILYDEAAFAFDSIPNLRSYRMQKS